MAQSTVMEMEANKTSTERDAQRSISQDEVVRPKLPLPESVAVVRVTDSPDLTEMPIGNGSGNNNSAEEESSQSPGQSGGTPAASTEKGKKRVVTRFSAREFEILKSEATLTFNPSMVRKKELAEELNIDLKRVIGFFNNAKSLNYSFAKKIVDAEKKAATALGVNNSMTSTPTPTVLPSGQNAPEFAATSTKRKRQPSKKAQEGDGSVKRASRSPAIADAMDVDSDDNVGLTIARSREQGLMKVDFGDEESEDDGAFPAVKSGRSTLTSTVAPNDNHVLGIPASQAATNEPDVRSKSPVMVTRTAGQRPSGIPIVPFDFDRFKRAADEAVNEARGLMSQGERERVDKNNRIPNRPHGSASPTNSRATSGTLSNNNKTLKKEIAQLEAEVNTKWSERENLKKRMHVLKAQYNEGNTELTILSDNYNAPGCSDEDKAALDKEFDMRRVALKKIQEEFAQLSLRIVRMKAEIETGSSDLAKLRYSGPRIKRYPANKTTNPERCRRTQY